MRMDLQVPVEVGMDAEHAALTREMHAAAEQMRIGEQVVDARERLENAHERRGIQVAERVAYRCGKFRLVAAAELHLEAGRRVVVPCDVVVGPRENLRQRLRLFGRQEIVDDDVRVGLRRAEFLGALARDFAEPSGVEHVGHACCQSENAGRRKRVTDHAGAQCTRGRGNRPARRGTRNSRGIHRRFAQLGA